MMLIVMPLVCTITLPVNVTLAKFTPVTHDDVEKCIKGAATKSCVLDVLPTWLLKENNYVGFHSCNCQYIINMSLSSGTFPTPLKLRVKSAHQKAELTL